METKELIIAHSKNRQNDTLSNEANKDLLTKGTIELHQT